MMSNFSLSVWKLAQIPSLQTTVHPQSDGLLHQRANREIIGVEEEIADHGEVASLAAGPDGLSHRIGRVALQA
jgi:hypothetical protein